MTGRLRATGLAEATGVPVRTVIRYEAEDGTPQWRTVYNLVAGLQAAGVDFPRGGEQRR